MKLQFFVIAFVLLIAGSAFASFSATYDVSVDTGSLGLSGTSGYLYLQYNPSTSIASTATVSNFVTDGTLGAQDTVHVVNGSAVSGTLPGAVTFNNTNGINDYNHAITFGSTLNFLLSLSSSSNPATTSGASTFSLGLFGDALGATPLVNVSNPNYAGTAIAINLNDNGTSSVTQYAPQASATPIPAAVYLFGSGLMGLVGIRRKMNK